MNKNLLLGGLAGGLIAIATALLFAPKSGAALIDEIGHVFSDKKPKKRATQASKGTASKRKKSSASKRSNIVGKSNS